MLKLFLLFAVSFTVLASDFSNYHYPLENPFQSTVTTAAINYFSGTDQGSKDIIEIELFPERKLTPFLKRRHKAQFTLTFHNEKWFKKEEPRPLVFVLAGFGGASIGGITNFMAQMYYRAGFNVIAIASPFQWKFNLGAFASATPGLIKNDTETLYEFMQLALDKSVAKHKLQVTDIYLAGSSLGAMEAIFLAQHDLKYQAFMFKKVLALNPPISVTNSLELLDQYHSVWKSFNDRQKDWVNYKLVAIASELKNSNKSIEQKLADIINDFPLPVVVSKALLGFNIHEDLAWSILVSELINKRGLFETYNDHYSPQPALNHAREYGFMDYFKKIVYPEYLAQGHSESFESFMHNMSVESKEKFLAENKHIYLFHNLDDPILKKEDVSWLKKMQGPNVMLYPKGGHLGNVWFEKNIQDYVGLFL